MSEENEPYTGLTDPEPEPQPEPEPEELEGDDDTAPPAEPEPEPELSDKEKALLKKAQDEKRKRQALEVELETLKKGQQPEPAPAKADDTPPGFRPKPVVDQFETYEDFVDALTDWKVDLRDHRATVQTRQQEVASKQEQSTVKARQTYADFDEVTAETPPFRYPDSTIEALRDSDHSADLLYHLCKNTAEAEKLAKLTPLAQIKELGRLEAKFEQKPAPTPPPRRVTQAPEPVAAVGGKHSVAPDPDNLSDDEWLTQERERLRKQGRLY